MAKEIIAFIDDTSPVAGDFLIKQAAAGGSGSTKKVSVENLIIPRGYIDGLITSNNGADASHDIDIAAGISRDSGNSRSISQTSTKTIAIDSVGDDGLLSSELASGIDLTFANVNPDTITAASGTPFSGVVAGDTVIIGNSSSNNGTFQVASATSTVITLEGSETLTDEGPVAATIHQIKVNTWHHVLFGIRTSDEAIVAGFSESIALPSGWSVFRRLGSVLTDAAANILGFSQVGNHFLWDDPLLDFDGPVAQTAVLITLSVPLGIQVLAEFNYFSFSSSSAELPYVSPLDADDEAPSSTAGPLRTGSKPTGQSLSDMLTLRTNTSSQIRAREENATDKDWRVATLGWTDLRGKDS